MELFDPIKIKLDEMNDIPSIHLALLVEKNPRGYFPNAFGSL